MPARIASDTSRTTSTMRRKNWNPRMAALMQEIGELIRWHDEFDKRPDAKEVKAKIKRWLHK